MNRSKTILGRSIAVVITCFMLCVIGITRADNPNPELDMKHDIDLGIILDTTMPLDLSVPITNRSTRKLTIAKVSKDCSCTTVTIEKMNLDPGETTILRVVTNLSGKTNLYSSDIIIESDAGEKLDEIHIHGRITGQIRIRPQRTTLLVGDKYAPGTFTVFCDDQNGKWKYVGFTAEDPGLRVAITEQPASPTTSTYGGIVDMDQNSGSKTPGDYRETSVTLKFVNDQLKKELQVRYPVDIAVRRNVTTDPAQITFSTDTVDQKRTIVVQSVDTIHIDSVTCNSSCVKASIRRLSENALLVELESEPGLISGDHPNGLACNLISNGKVVSSIPINIVSLH